MRILHAILYRRPVYVDTLGPPDAPSDQNSIEHSTKSGATGIASGIPDALSFDRIIASGTCPPCTIRDFMNYLKYIEFAAENLQFFLWYYDYEKRFNQLDPVTRLLAPEWTATNADNEIMVAQFKATAQAKNRETAAIFQGTMFDSKPKVLTNEFAINPFATPTGSLTSDSASNFRGTSNNSNWEFNGGDLGSDSARSHARAAASAFENAKLNWQPFTIQPFREEIARIIATYIAEGAPRELNISARERTSVLHALRNTTHPSALRTIISTTEWSLRHQAHPNFIRWAICNANPPRVTFARSLGVGCVTGGFALASILTASHVGRGWRASAAILWFLGFSTLFSAWKGMCIVLHGMHHRQMRPWELFSETEEDWAYELQKMSNDSVSSSNSFENEPWVPQYGNRNVLSRTFDREVWIQEPALRHIQDAIFIQSVVLGFITTLLLTGVFLVMPSGNKF
ncbi:MAG: hypothetical protein M1839_006844 [Geoglossum umbratile]|nr:MAG: hypothetical protein M1839_006844 [Geoglossum umbratile]